MDEPLVREQRHHQPLCTPRMSHDPPKSAGQTRVRTGREASLHLSLRQAVTRYRALEYLQRHWLPLSPVMPQGFDDAA